MFEIAMPRRKANSSIGNADFNNRERQQKLTTYHESHYQRSELLKRTHNSTRNFPTSMHNYYKLIGRPNFNNAQKCASHLSADTIGNAIHAQSHLTKANIIDASSLYKHSHKRDTAINAR